MSENRVMANLLAPISLVIKPPVSADSGDTFRAWLAIYDEALAGYDVDTLRHARQKVTKTWNKGWFPKPAELAKFCDEAEAEISHRNRLANPNNFRQSAIDCVKRCNLGGLPLPDHITPEDVERMESLGLV